MKDTNHNPITEEEFMKDMGHGVVDMKNCIRVHPYGLNDPTPLCNYGSCSHVLLPSEKFCPCHTQSNNWETIVLMALNGAGVDEKEADLQIRVITPMMEEYIAEQKKELVNEAIETLTVDISKDKFINDGFNRWHIFESRGLEPCPECENGANIRKFIKSLNHHD